MTMTSCNAENMIAMFDDILSKMIKHIEAWHPEHALFLAKDTQRKLRKVQAHLLNSNNCVSKKQFPPHQAAV